MLHLVFNPEKAMFQLLDFIVIASKSKINILDASNNNFDKTECAGYECFVKCIMAVC